MRARCQHFAYPHSEQADEYESLLGDARFRTRAANVAVGGRRGFSGVNVVKAVVISAANVVAKVWSW